MFLTQLWVNPTNNKIVIQIDSLALSTCSLLVTLFLLKRWRFVPRENTNETAFSEVAIMSFDSQGYCLRKSGSNHWIVLSLFVLFSNSQLF
jgi:hypothetical protein